MVGTRFINAMTTLCNPPFPNCTMACSVRLGQTQVALLCSTCNRCRPPRVLIFDPSPGYPRYSTCFSRTCEHGLRSFHALIACDRWRIGLMNGCCQYAATTFPPRVPMLWPSFDVVTTTGYIPKPVLFPLSQGTPRAPTTEEDQKPADTAFVLARNSVILLSILLLHPTSIVLYSTLRREG